MVKLSGKSALFAMLSIAGMGLLVSSTAAQQTTTLQAPTADSKVDETVAAEQQDQRKATLLELETLQQQIELNDKQRLALKQQISNFDKDRVSINRELIETSKKARSLEKRVSKASNRLIELRQQEAGIRRFLKSKTALLSEVLAALQRMGRNPPPALLVTPQDALSSVRSAILLGAVVPEIRGETETLISQLRDMVRITTEIEGQRDGLTSDLTALAGEEERLNLLLQEKKKLSGVAQQKLAEEYSRSVELASKATSLKELIGSLEAQIESAREAAQAARLADERRKQIEQARLETNAKYTTQEAFSDPSRQAPALSFQETKGLLPLPVNGELVSDFGEKDDLGDEVLGQNLQTRENARVISPADGWIVYAGPFRTYGQLLIINAGNDYHIVMAGMEEINAAVGQFVIVGEPIGKMGAKRVASAGSVDLSLTKPILYVEFRKDSTPIDPSDWWSEQNIQRVANGS